MSGPQAGSCAGAYAWGPLPSESLRQWADSVAGELDRCERGMREQQRETRQFLEARLAALEAARPMTATEVTARRYLLATPLPPRAIALRAGDGICVDVRWLDEVMRLAGEAQQRLNAGRYFSNETDRRLAALAL